MAMAMVMLMATAMNYHLLVGLFQVQTRKDSTMLQYESVAEVKVKLEAEATTASGE